jgi:transposase-like protein
MNLTRVTCPSCGSEHTSLVEPDDPYEFAYRCYSCGRRWNTFAETWPSPMDRKADRLQITLPRKGIH